MLYLIDGHNLIPKLGLHLADIDDEAALVTRLQEFCRLHRAQVEVYFDGALPGHPSHRSYGAVSAHFVRRGTPADAAIEAHLERLGRQARNLTVVSSDGRVQKAARAVHATPLTSEEFASLLSRPTQHASAEKPDGSLPAGEVEDWMDIFNAKKG